MHSYPIPAKTIRVETRVSNSRFIATLGAVFSTEEARNFIAGVREEMPDASHHVTASLLGGGNSVTAHSNDDGEPAGSAGKPALAVLRGSGLGDAALVITRYFGGTKLGVGGLVRAYTEAAQLAVQAAPLARRVPTVTLLLRVPYPLLERVRRLLPGHEGMLLGEEFFELVSLQVRLPQEYEASFLSALSSLSNGRLSGEKIDSGLTILPLSM